MLRYRPTTYIMRQLFIILKLILKIFFHHYC